MKDRDIIILLIMIIMYSLGIVIGAHTFKAVNVEEFSDTRQHYIDTCNEGREYLIYKYDLNQIHLACQLEMK